MASVGKIFKLRQKFANHKRKDWQSDYIITTGFVHQQNTTNTQKNPHQDWQVTHVERYFATSEESLFRIYEKHTQINNWEDQLFYRKKGRKKQIGILWKRKYECLKYMKICLASLGIRKTKFKP